jgi:uncharacterized protein (UPF0333 family)
MRARKSQVQIKLRVLLLLLALLWMFVQIACTYHAAKTSQVSSHTNARAAAAAA